MINKKIYETIGSCWIDSLKNIYSNGTKGEETTELYNINLNFFYTQTDDILNSYGKIENIEEMKKVFFSDKDNIYGHSYKNLISGPYKQKDLSDVVAILKEKSTSNRAIVLYENSYKKQPCINCIHFKLREGILNTTYFSRGQDFYNKFYCDAVCISIIDNYIKTQLKITKSFISAFISSAHIYNSDLNSVKILLDKYYENYNNRS